ncbi:hypothetical protein NQ317_015183 [Molorchus minor]|uniref:Uncharacterized protein n=1 Tax=Molorchus minor TaxID=1323400 RepID=A0ABQ9K546_9CUCU|nr:hypothetical protein NQ317_015183 [Molorchus minor]
MQAHLVLFVILALGSTNAHGYEDEESYSIPAKYQFEYGVSSPLTGDIKSQREHREGELVDGQYALRESDGTTRLVQYRSGPKSGFEAVVQRAGVALHPALGVLGQGIGGQAFGIQGLGVGGHGYAPKTFGGYGHAYTSPKYNGAVGGQGFGGQGFGGPFGGFLGGGFGNSYVGTTVWKNQGHEQGHGYGFGHNGGLVHGY